MPADRRFSNKPEQDLALLLAEFNQATLQITELLEPWRDIAQVINSMSKAGVQLNKSMEAIRAGRVSNQEVIFWFVRELVERLIKRSIVASRANIVNSRKHARETIKAVDRLKHQLSIFGGEKHFNKLYAELAEAHSVCEEIVKFTKTEGAKATEKRACAETALKLIELCSVKPATNGSADCAYRAITAVLYKYISRDAKNEDVDLRHVCTEVFNATNGDRAVFIIRSAADRERAKKYIANAPPGTQMEISEPEPGATKVRKRSGRITRPRKRRLQKSSHKIV